MEIKSNKTREIITPTSGYLITTSVTTACQYNNIILAINEVGIKCPLDALVYIYS